MVRLLFIIFLTLLTSCAKTTYFAIKTNSSDVFYQGVQNPFLIAGQNADKAIITVIGGNAIPFLIKKDTFIANITVGANYRTTVIVSINNKKYEYDFRDKKIPDPTVMLMTDSGLVSGGLISAEKIRSAYSHSFIPQLWSFDYNANFKVSSYKLTTFFEGEKVTNNYSGSQITSGLVKNAKSGDIFIFHDINIEFIEPKEKRVIDEVTFIVK